MPWNPRTISRGSSRQTDYAWGQRIAIVKLHNSVTFDRKLGAGNSALCMSLKLAPRLPRSRASLGCHAVQAKDPLLAAPSWSLALIDGELTFHITSTKWGRPLYRTLQKTCEDIVIENSVIAHRTYANGKISCLCPLILVLLSVVADSNENENDSFDHFTKQPNTTVREESSGRVIGNATLDDDSLLPRQNSLQPLPLHIMMLYHQKVVPGDC